MVKRFFTFYIFTLIVVTLFMFISFVFNLYEKDFELVIPNSIMLISMNNIGVFGKTLGFSIVSFGFLGTILVTINLAIISSNLVSIITIYGLKTFLLVMLYGIVELGYIPIVACATLEVIDIFKIIYNKNSIDKTVLLKIKEKIIYVINLSVIGVFILLLAGLLEYIVSKFIYVI